MNPQLQRALLTLIALLCGVGSQFPGLSPAFSQGLMLAAVGLLAKEWAPQSVKPLLLLLWLGGSSVACGPDAAGGGATPENASVAIMGETVDDDTGAVLHPPVCVGVAVAPTAILTAAHCPPVGDSFLIVDAVTWQRTSSGVAFADLAFDAGELRTLVPRQPLLNWATLGEARDGPAAFVSVRGSDFVALSVTVSGQELSGTMQEHGDSGAGVFQSGLLVGIVMACNSSNDRDCDLPGGRMVGVP